MRVPLFVKSLFVWQVTDRIIRPQGAIPMEPVGAQRRGSSQSFKRKELVGKLNPTCLRAFKAAADAAKLRGNPYVEFVHWIEQLVLSDRSDVQLMLADAGV